MIFRVQYSAYDVRHSVNLCRAEFNITVYPFTLMRKRVNSHTTSVCSSLFEIGYKDMGLFPGQMTLWEEMQKNTKKIKTGRVALCFSCLSFHLRPVCCFKPYNICRNLTLISFCIKALAESAELCYDLRIGFTDRQKLYNF